MQSSEVPGFQLRAHRRKQAAPDQDQGYSKTAANSEAQIVFFHVGIEGSTVFLSISAGDAVVGRCSFIHFQHGSSSERPHSLTIFKRSRFAPVGSRSAETTKSGALVHRRQARGQTSLNCLWCMHQVQDRGSLHRLF